MKCQEATGGTAKEACKACAYSDRHRRHNKHLDHCLYQLPRIVGASEKGEPLTGGQLEESLEEAAQSFCIQ